MEPGEFTELLWSFRPGERVAPKTLAEVPATTPESVAMSKALKKKGFVFVGPTTAYALMQASGIVNDHLADCIAR
jgi:DNA-3-methyladenine glycosylase I